MWHDSKWSDMTHHLQRWTFGLTPSLAKQQGDGHPYGGVVGMRELGVASEFKMLNFYYVGYYDVNSGLEGQ